MLLTTTTTQVWNSRNKKRYVDLGYTYTKMGDSFEVNVRDLSVGSHAVVHIKCDYCGKVIEKEWCSYNALKEGSFLPEDCCTDCKWSKIQSTLETKYGDNRIAHTPDCESKRARTNLKRYGAENVFASDIIKKKIIETNFEKYGVKNYNQTQEAKDNYRKVCMERYNVPYFLLLNYAGENNRGENNPRWKGGVEYHRQERSTSEYIDWRKSVYKRDNYTCQCCGASGGTYLNAHHLYNWKDYPEKRYDVDNGVTLCVDCHMQFHSTYGKNNNTPEQYYEFINYDKKIC